MSEDLSNKPEASDQNRQEKLILFAKFFFEDCIPNWITAITQSISQNRSELHILSVEERLQQKFRADERNFIRSRLDPEKVITYNTLATQANILLESPFTEQNAETLLSLYRQACVLAYPQERCENAINAGLEMIQTIKSLRTVLSI